MKFDWKSLSERERLFVLGGGGVVALFCLIQFCIVPILGWRADMAEKRTRSQELYQLVARASAFAEAGAGEGRDLSTPVRNAVTDSARAAGITLNFVNQRPDDGIDVNVVAAPATLYAWLATLDKESGIVVSVADIARETGDTGAVRAQMTLIRRATS